MSFSSVYNKQFSMRSRSQPKNPIGKPTAQDRNAKEKASRERRKAALRAKKAAVRNTRETFKQLPGTSGGRRTRRTLRKTRRSRK